MCRAEVHPLPRSRIQPTVERAAAREFQDMDGAPRIDHRKFQIALEGRSNDGLPIYNDLRQIPTCRCGSPQPVQ